MFHRKWELELNFARKSVADQSRFFGPSQMGPIGPLEQHQVSYDVNGKAFFHTEPRELNALEYPEALKAATSRINEGYFESLFGSVSRILEESEKFPPRVPKALSKSGYALRASYLLRRHFNLTWMLLEDLQSSDA